MNSEKTVTLIENFVSWQGEGPDTGQAMIILRFKTCNLNCKWCDTSVKMRISAESKHTLSQIQESINQNRAGLLITGGEPTVKRHIAETLFLLNDLNYPIANVETNGFQLEELIKLADPSKNIHFIYSPKIFDKKDLKKAMLTASSLLDNNNVFIKIVYEENSLIINYLEWLTKQIDVTKANKVWLMPEGITKSDLITNSKGVFDACEKYKFNFSSRSHIIFGFV